MKRILVTGGAGFIGSHLANYFLKKKNHVTVFDNFSRKGTGENGEWLKKNHPRNLLTIVGGDIRSDFSKLKRIIKNCDVILHMASQVAVTSSVRDPREDFDINVLGTFNVLEATRLGNPKAVFIFASSNKVYGGMEDIKIKKLKERYIYKDLPFGIPETRYLDFHSPYGCSKGAGDQYVRDYARIYNLKTIVFRQSCIYGPRQFGIEDQGWIAWFVIASMLGRPITIYGDGRQVRDVLFIEDLLRAYETAIKKSKIAAGKIYNIGGGRKNTTSLLELIALLEEIFKKEIEHSFDDWRSGDQPVYISDIRKAEKELSWNPKVSVKKGVKKLANWARKNHAIIKDIFE